MGDASRPLVVVPVTGAAGALVAEERSRWTRAGNLEPHVVVVFGDEAPDLRLLRARLEVACGRIPPFPLRLGPVVAPEGRSHRGVHHAVTDPVGAWWWLREFLLAPPFRRLDVVPHVPVVQTGLRGAKRARRALAEMGGTDPGLEFRVAELVLVHDGPGIAGSDRYRLAAPEPSDPSR